MDSFTAGTQTRASMLSESSVTYMSATTNHAVEENHVIDWDKATVVDREDCSDRPDRQEVQLSQKDRATFRVIGYFVVHGRNRIT